jgi:RimJ/RimL family protein N-acetyltransferase
MIPSLIQTERQRGLCLPHGLLFGHDVAVTRWASNEFKLNPSHINSAIGVVRNNRIVGAVMFQGYSGHNVELSYYGPMTLSLGVFKAVANYTLQRFTVDRLTVRTNRKNLKLIRSFRGLGFKFEGVQHRYYGAFGDAAMFVLFKEDLERIGGLEARTK